jgi:hypothetical protein
VSTLPARRVVRLLTSSLQWHPPGSSARSGSGTSGGRDNPGLADSSGATARGRSAADWAGALAQEAARRLGVAPFGTQRSSRLSFRTERRAVRNLADATVPLVISNGAKRSEESRRCVNAAPTTASFHRVRNPSSDPRPHRDGRAFVPFMFHHRRRRLHARMSNGVPHPEAMPPQIDPSSGPSGRCTERSATVVPSSCERKDHGRRRRR